MVGGPLLLFAGTALAGVALDVAVTPRVLVRRDEAFSPRGYVAPAPGGRLGGRLDGEAWQHRLSLDAALGRGRSGPSWTFTSDGEVFETPASSFVDVALREASLRVIGPLKLGLAPSAEVSTAVFSFGRGGVFTYYATLGPELAGEVEVPLPGAHRLDLSLALPTAAWVARSPYALNDDRYIATIAGGGGLGSVFGLLGRGRVETWGTRQAVRAGASWTWARPGIAPTAGLELAAERHVAPWGEALVRSSVRLSAGAVFGGR